MFNLSYQYARARQPDAIYVLSARHGLVPEGTVISPYDETLHDMSAQEVRKWAGRVLDSIGSRHDLSDTRFLILAGKKYRKNLVPDLPSCEIPMAGLGIGEQLHFLKTQLEPGLAQQRRALVQQPRLDSQPTLPIRSYFPLLAFATQGASVA